MSETSAANPIEIVHKASGLFAADALETGNYLEEVSGK